MHRKGELVRWRSPLDEEYSYGFIKEIGTRYVVVQGTGYYNGVEALVHIKNIEKLERRGGDTHGRSKEHN